MQTGRLTESIRKRSVLKKITYRSRQLIGGPAAWEDCARLDVAEQKHMVFCVDAVSGHLDILPQKAFYRLANRVAACGAEPGGILMTLLLPEAAEEICVKQIMEQTAGLASARRMDILGVHTEVLSTVTQPVLSLTGVGFLAPEINVKHSRVKPGADIVMTKWAGVTGAAERVITSAGSAEKELFSRFSPDFLEQTGEQFRYINSMADARIAAEAGAFALHCAGEGGVYEALWELGEACGSGLAVDVKKIPIRQETIEICEFFDDNPYTIPSDGVLLAVTEAGGRLVERLTEAGIPAAVIGSTTDERARIVCNGEEKRFLAPRGSSMCRQD